MCFFDEFCVMDDDDDLCYVCKQCTQQTMKKLTVNDLEYALKTKQKKTCNWSTAHAHQDYPPKISSKSKYLHTFYTHTHAIIAFIHSVWLKNLQCSTYFHLFVEPSSLFRVSATRNLRDSAVCATATNQQWPNKTNDWSKFIHKWLKKYLFIRIHKWMHISNICILFIQNACHYAENWRCKRERGRERERER